jgi:hypothetical protein
VPEVIALFVGPEPPGLLCDNNDDGVVDADDCVAWRRTDGTIEQFNLWRASFGATLETGFAASPITTAWPTSLWIPRLVSALPYCVIDALHALFRPRTSANSSLS